MIDPASGTDGSGPSFRGCVAEPEGTTMAVRGAPRLAVALALVGVLVVGLSGCVGSPTSRSAWSETADGAIGQVVSGLGTVRVVLETYPEQRLTRSYAIGTLSDVVATTDKEV